MFASNSLGRKCIKDVCKLFSWHKRYQRCLQAIRLAQKVLKGGCKLFAWHKKKEEKRTKLKGYNETRLWVINAIMCELILCVYVCVVYG